MDKFETSQPPSAPPVYSDSPINQGYGYDQPSDPRSMQPMPPPIMQQPAAVTTVVIQQQPQLVQASRNWNTGLCGCLTDCESCCCTMFCMLCYMCSISSEMGEGLCMPCCVPTPTAIAMLRLKLRMQEHIDGEIKDDYCVSCCCPPCALCQLKREMDISRRRQQTI